MAISLDYNAAAAVFFLRLPRGGGDPEALIREYGLNFSVPDSTHAEAILYTKDPFCAASFHQFATQAAASQLDWIAREIAASRALTSGRHIALPPGKELIPFQLASADYILGRANALDADEMGLGKTPTAIAVANERQAKRIIVVCLASTRQMWFTRVREWSTLHDPHCYLVKAAKWGISDTAEWTIISYELARNPAILRALTKLRFDLLIVDEVQQCKEVDSARSRAIFGYHDGRVDDGESTENVVDCLSNVSETVLVMSGAPIPNRPSEAYVLCRNLDHSSIDWMSQKAFRERFNPQSKGRTAEGKVWVHEEEGRLPELGNRLRAHFMCRHMEIDVRHQLKAAFPDPIYDLIYLEETVAVKQALEAERMLDIDPETLAGRDFKILGEISTVRMQMGLAMAPQVADYLQALLEGGARKLVIFAWHKEVLDILCGQLAPWGVLRVDGSDSGDGKHGKVQAFIKRPEIDVMVGNIQALGTGTDGLQQVASHCLFAEPDWVPATNDQCVKRLARIGQMSRVLADFFLVRNSMAEKVLATSLRKAGTLHKVLDRDVRDVIPATSLAAAEPHVW